MMRMLYVLLTRLLVPWVIAHDAWQGFLHRDQRGRLGQRLGYVERVRGAGAIWIHAVSVGEVQAAAALVRALQRRHPALPIVVSTVTATGAQRARALFEDGVQHCYLPYDLPGAVRRFLDRISPQVTVILETEIWPTLYAELGRRGIPLVLGSARLSARSVERYRRMPSLLRDTLSKGNVTVGAQTGVDAERFRAIGAAGARVQVTGNIKYDLQIPEAQVEAGRALRQRWGAGRPVWIAGSTHEGEEQAALAAHVLLRQRHPTALLLLVPRHPQRFEGVRGVLRNAGVRFAQRSSGEMPGAGDDVFLVDTIGELQMFYAASDVAFVGGSLVPIGGHSLLEPAVLGLPILSGPHTHNGPDIAALLEQGGALRIVPGHEALGQALLEWVDAPAEAREAGARGRRAVAANRGAVDRLVGMIEPLLVSSSAAPRAASSAP
ncbi:MAG TPA: lipid IV(A) 3-deoxy-D-manno-octulosonic acid transferase [Steroidobacteraceae bacterium]|nr:lipid IV(A) 3-deoxy-D-manno-octulosonic acid transferase [Steroidobacteraceae bacterium]